jgi:hypothetical protein
MSSEVLKRVNDIIAVFGYLTSYILIRFSTLKMEASGSSGTLVALYQTMQLHIREDSNSHYNTKFSCPGFFFQLT